MTPETFPRCRRLLQAEQFTKVFKRGRFIRRHGAVRVRCMENNQASPRLGIIVPKKGNRTAVRRNRIKRIIRDQFRLTQTQLLPLDIIVHVTSPVTDGELRNTVTQCLMDMTSQRPKE
ncbi:MAG: ribonuclease P protein component [Gammaproteobacteria bacterium]